MAAAVSTLLRNVFLLTWAFSRVILLAILTADCNLHRSSSSTSTATSFRRPCSVWSSLATRGPDSRALFARLGSSLDNSVLHCSIVLLLIGGPCWWRIRLVALPALVLFFRILPQGFHPFSIAIFTRSNTTDSRFLNHETSYACPRLFSKIAYLEKCIDWRNRTRCAKQASFSRLVFSLSFLFPMRSSVIVQLTTRHQRFRSMCLFSQTPPGHAVPQTTITQEHFWKLTPHRHHAHTPLLLTSHTDTHERTRSLKSFHDEGRTSSSRGSLPSYPKPVPMAVVFSVDLVNLSMRVNFFDDDASWRPWESQSYCHRSPRLGV